MDNSKRLAGIIGFGLCCGFLVAPPGCRHTPGHLPHPPGLSLATALKLQIPLDAPVSATNENLARLADRHSGRNGSGPAE